MIEQPENAAEKSDNPQTEPDDTIEDVVERVHESVAALQQFCIRCPVRMFEAGADVQEQLLNEFKKLVADFGAAYPLLRQRHPWQADAGLQHIIDTLKDTPPPFGWKALRNYQYNPGAVFYRDLLKRAETQWKDEGEKGENREFFVQAQVARAGWLRRHGDVNESIDYAVELHSRLGGGGDASKRSSVEYELAQAYWKKGNTGRASMWMERSAQSAAEAGDERRGRITRAEALHWRMESDPVGCEDAIIALRKEFENQAREGKSDEEREEGRRWVLNTTCWLAHAASKLENAENLEKYIAEIDVEEGLEKRWLPPAELTELRVGLERLKRA